MLVADLPREPQLRGSNDASTVLGSLFDETITSINSFANVEHGTRPIVAQQWRGLVRRCSPDHSNSYVP